MHEDRGPAGQHDPPEDERELGEAGSRSEAREVVPLVAEVPRVDTRVVETGRVRVSTSTRSWDESFDVDLTREGVEVERVPVGREVDGPVEIRQEGDVTIVPVLEEVLVVRKQLVLKEEVRVRRLRERRSETHTVNLRYQEPVVERSGVDAAAGSEASEEPDGRRKA